MLDCMMWEREEEGLEEPQDSQLATLDEGIGSLNPQDIWDFDGLLWGSLTDGLEMPCHGMPNLEFGDGPGATSRNTVTRRPKDLRRDYDNATCTFNGLYNPLKEDARVGDFGHGLRSTCQLSV